MKFGIVAALCVVAESISNEAVFDGPDMVIPEAIAALAPGVDKQSR